MVMLAEGQRAKRITMKGVGARPVYGDVPLKVERAKRIAMKGVGARPVHGDVPLKAERTKCIAMKGVRGLTQPRDHGQIGLSKKQLGQNVLCFPRKREYYLAVRNLSQ